MGVSGLILTGGKATRMDGANKALMPFLGHPMISHVIERLSPQVRSEELTSELQSH